jgi:hypothetical protein
MDSKSAIQMTSDLKTDTYQNVSGDPHGAPVRIHELGPASRKVQLVIVCATAITIASIGSHILTTWLNIRTAAGAPFSVGTSNAKPPAYLAGSSLAGQGLAWARISKELDQRIVGWGIAGGSPFEWEIFQPRASEARTTFIVVSAYDLDEAILCDFRAEVVPIRHTIKALAETHADWPYSKRALSQYPMSWLRVLFPTLGRSKGIMGELRTKLSKLISPSRPVESEAGPTLSFGREAAVEGYRNARITDWSEAEVLRKLTAMSSGFQGNHSFQGLKHHALQRMLQYGKNAGAVKAIVLPVSPLYAKEFMTAELAQQFESSIAEMQRSVPGIPWARLDRLGALNSNDNFYDLAHMNPTGQQMTTNAFLNWLRDSEAR